jgi:hypothetical protein
MLPSFVCVCTCFLICPFTCDYINIDLSAVELLEIELLLLLLFYCHYIDCHILYFFFNYFCVFLCVRANFVIGLWAVKFARK